MFGILKLPNFERTRRYWDPPLSFLPIWEWFDIFGYLIPKSGVDRLDMNLISRQETR